MAFGGLESGKGMVEGTDGKCRGWELAEPAGKAARGGWWCPSKGMLMDKQKKNRDGIWALVEGKGC